MLVTDRRRGHVPLERMVRHALEGGVTAVMLREKDLGTAALVELGRPVAALCREAQALLVVNHDVAAARALGADGVHLGYRSPRPEEARRELGPSMLVGVSTHDADELDRALRGGADYVTYGPVFDTPLKRGLVEPCGTAGLAAAVAQAGTVPVIGLGGIDSDRVGAVRRAGASGLACIGAILDADDARAAAARLLASWRAAA
jgi:thiamine-phosphate diphosphorylase